MRLTRGKEKWLLLPVVFMLVTALSLAGCGGDGDGGGDGELSGTINEAGSTTVQPLAEKMANAFMAEYPRVKIIVQVPCNLLSINSGVWVCLTAVWVCNGCCTHRVGEIWW